MPPSVENVPLCFKLADCQFNYTLSQPVIQCKVDGETFLGGPKTLKMQGLEYADQ
jgi:hypothetical protein